MWQSDDKRRELTMWPLKLDAQATNLHACVENFSA
jgi:hypothetical protein